MLQQQVKIFSGFGKAGIERLEKQVNEWLLEHEIAQIVNSQSALCQVAESASGEGYQCMTITIWYRSN
jgi:hypothetical protein